jgi:hypothetical protein
MGMVYQWKPGSKAPVEAQVAGEELERIRTWHNGRLEAKMVVEASIDPGAPLHRAFEWDDQRAAHAFRVEQAKYLIRSVEVVIDRGQPEPKPIRAFVSVVRDEDRSYTSTVHALADQDLRVQVIEQAWKELEAWRQRHAELVEFAKVFALIDQARGAK